MNNLITRIRVVILVAFMMVLGTTAAEANQGLNPMDGKPVAPDFSLKDLDGDMQSLSDFKGKVVIVNFWATWCPPCRAEMPSMQRAWNVIRNKDVVMLAVHVGGNEDKIWSFVGDYELDFTVLIDPKSKVADAWPMEGLPSTFVVDPEGRIVYRAIGAREWDDPKILENVYALRK